MTENKTGRDMLELVRKLLAKAERTDNDAERDAFNGRAADLIAKYGIEQALLDAAKTGAQKETVGDRIVHVPAPYAGEKAALLHNVSEPLRVHAVRHRTRRSSGGFNVHLFGFAVDLDRVDLLFTSLLVQTSFGLATVRPPYGIHPVRYRKGWIWGFIHTVRARLDEAENRAAREARWWGDGPSTDLVLADRRAMATRRAHEVYSDIKPGRKATVAASAYEDGQAAGRRADLGGTRITRTQGKQIGR